MNETSIENKTRAPHNSAWVIVTFKRSFLWVRHMAENENETDETWMMVSPRRYILNANQLSYVSEHIESISDLKQSAHYRPLIGHPNLASAKVLVERYRDRGIGDLLFLTGPLSYLNHLSGNTVKLFIYTLVNRAPTLQGLPFLNGATPQYGPIHYDDLPLYHYHWMIDTVTEYDEEPEQLNVYDALYKQLGLNYEQIDPRFKRPTIFLDPTDLKNLDSFYYFVFNSEKKLDLRKVGYYVVAPLSHSSIRSASYGQWLNIIRELAQRRPVIVIGQVTERMPETDMKVSDFYQQLNGLHAGVINLIGNTPLRLIMAIISKAVGVVCLDSAPLYIAQAFRVPAVSLWGPHHPGVRIGYDNDYMALAIWNNAACRYSPCFSYQSFPVSKCPLGESQAVCQVLEAVDAGQVIEKMNQVESVRRAQSSYKMAVPAGS